MVSSVTNPRSSCICTPGDCVTSVRSSGHVCGSLYFCVAFSSRALHSSSSPLDTHRGIRCSSGKTCSQRSTQAQGSAGHRFSLAHQNTLPVAHIFTFLNQPRLLHFHDFSSSDLRCQVRLCHARGTHPATPARSKVSHHHQQTKNSCPPCHFPQAVTNNQGEQLLHVVSRRARATREPRHHPLHLVRHNGPDHEVYPPGQNNYMINSQNGEFCNVIGLINYESVKLCNVTVLSCV